MEETVSANVSETSPSTSPPDEKPWQFKKGNPGPKGLRKRRFEPTPSASPEQQLADMEWVYGHPEKDDFTQGQRTMRHFKERSPVKFLERLWKLQKEGRSQVPAPAPVDRGEERLDAVFGGDRDYQPYQPKWGRVEARPETSPQKPTMPQPEVDSSEARLAALGRIRARLPLWAGRG